MELNAKKTDPRIAVQFSSFEGKAVNTIPFKPGMMLRQGGRVYQVDAKGTFRRVKDNK